MFTFTRVVVGEGEGLRWQTERVHTMEVVQARTNALMESTARLQSAAESAWAELRAREAAMTALLQELAEELESNISEEGAQ